MWSPAERYRSDNASAAKVFVDTADSHLFKDAAEVAIAQMVADLKDTTDPVEAAAGYQRMLGARQLLTTLTTIAVPPAQLPARSKTDNLDHTV